MSDDSNKFSKRSFLKTAAKVTGGSSAFTLFQALFRAPSAEAQTWKKIGDTGPAAGLWQKLKLASEIKYPYTHIGGGLYYSAALRADGLVYATGECSSFFCGINNDCDNLSAFTPTIGVSNVTAIEVGGGHIVALRADGAVFTVGYGDGQVGDNTNSDRSTFTSAIGLSNIAAIAAGLEHTLALRADGSVFASGKNGFGQLGDNTTSNRITFVSAKGVSDVVAISAGAYHSLALRADGAVFACGSNDGYGYKGRLGDNTTINKSTFVSTIGISNCVSISTNNWYCMALRSDGIVFGVGGHYGALGNNSTAPVSTYTSAVGISNIVALAAGNGHTLALRSDSFVFASGQNYYGALGDNTTLEKSTFVSAVGLSNVIAVSAGDYFSMALRADGAVFACGENYAGQLGVGDDVDKSSFTLCV